MFTPVWLKSCADQLAPTSQRSSTDHWICAKSSSCYQASKRNTLKTVEMIVDFRRNRPALPPLTIMTALGLQWSFRFLGTTISQDLKWDNHIESIVKKAQQRLYFLHQVRTFNLPQELLIQFYSAIIESVLCTSITVWFSSATKSDLRRLRRVVRTAEANHWYNPLSRNCTYPEWAKGLEKNHSRPSHPAHSLFELLPSGRSLQKLWAPERPDTETVSSLKQSISWTLDINYGTQHYLLELSRILVWNEYPVRIKHFAEYEYHTSIRVNICARIK